MSDVVQPNTILVVDQNVAGDTIIFRPDSRFINQTSLPSNDSAAEAQRDVTSHVVVTKSGDNAQYRVALFTPLFDRVKFTKIIDKSFSELDNA